MPIPSLRPEGSEQATQRIWLPIQNHQLSGHLRLALPLVRVAVPDIQALEVEGRPQVPSATVS